MTNNLLIIGTGGKTKFGFLDEIKRLGRKVIIIDHEDNVNIEYPNDVKVFFLPSLNKESVLKKAKALNEIYAFETAGTIFESCMETAAYVRQNLGLPGYSYEKVILSRNKILMMNLLEGAGVTAPRSKSFTNDMAKDEIISLAAGFNIPFILKPTLACANIGLRKICSYEGFWQCYQDALGDIRGSPRKSHESEDWSKGWLLCEYINGKEVEIDIYVEEGEIRFKAIQEKTLIFEHKEFISENNAVIPPLTLSDVEVKNLNAELKKLAKAVWLNIAKPCGVKYFNVYSEFRIDGNGRPYCLEFTLRIGGAMMPVSVLKSTGINTFESAARTLLGLKMSIPSYSHNKGVCWQMLFSDRRGIYRGVEGLPDSGLSVIPYKNVGDEIKIPHFDFLCCVMAEAMTAAEASDMVADALKRAYVLIESPDGGVEKIGIPISPAGTCLSGGLSL